MMRDSYTEHEQGQNNLLTTRNRKTGHIWEWGNERQVGESQLVIRALPLYDQH